MDRTMLTMLVCVVMCAACSTVAWAVPMGTAFTYQGRLQDPSGPAEGVYDFEFTLYDAAAGPSQVGGTINKDDEQVADGYFTVQLDFGGGVFDGAARWLDIAVRPGASNDPFTILSPRQEVTPTPYALYAKSAGGDNDWMVSGNDMYSIPSGNVGIGTTSPSSLLHVRGAQSTYATLPNYLGVFSGVSNDHSYIGVEAPANFDSGYRFLEESNVRWHLFNDGDDSDKLKFLTGSFLNVMTLQSDGNVGIGTSSPLYPLEVRRGQYGYLGYFYNDNDSSGTANGIFAKGDAFDTGINMGRGGYFSGIGGSGGGDAYGVQSDAYAYGTAPAYGVYSYATGGDTNGREYAFYGVGDGYFSGNVGIGTTNPSYKLDVEGGVSDYLGAFRNNNPNGADYSTTTGILARGDASGTGNRYGIGGVFYAYGGNIGGTASGTRHYAYAYGTSTAYGVYSRATGGTTSGREYAFYGQGDGYFSGTLSKGGGSFKIDHPLDPENKYLYHSFVESPDMMNVYNGNIILDGNGEAAVDMPDWFEALNRDFRYQLTAIGAPGPNLYIAGKISNNSFKIAGGIPGMEVSWQVTGIRQDAFANANRIPVEEDKQGIEEGTYLHPEAFGLPEEMSLHKVHEAEMMPEMKVGN